MRREAYWSCSVQDNCFSERRIRKAKKLPYEDEELKLNNLTFFPLWKYFLKQQKFALVSLAMPLTTGKVRLSFWCCMEDHRRRKLLDGDGACSTLLGEGNCQCLMGLVILLKLGKPEMQRVCCTNSCRVLE